MDKMGRVVSTSGKYAKVEVIRSSACGEKCSSCKGGCTKNASYIQVENTANAQPSQFVMLQVDTKTVMGAAFFAYILPLIMLIVGIAVGTFIFSKLRLPFPSELFTFFIGMAFMTLSYGMVRYFDSSYKSKEKIKYHIAKIV